MEEEASKLENEIEGMYTSLSVAKDEIQKRWGDEDLKKKVGDFLGGDMPKIFSDRPKAIIFRNIATPNLELRVAREYAQMMGLELVVVEYTADRFCTRNRDKLHLGKMVFIDTKNKLKPSTKKNIIAIKEDDNMCLNKIQTLWGENLVAFHHRIFQENGFGDVATFDASVYKLAGLSPYEIYLKILSFCSRSTVLLENFLIKTDKGERKFTEQVIFPAFAEIEKKFGFRPMIVPLLSTDEDEDILWQYYPEEVKLGCGE
ncbi:MAG: hypothetical protein NTY33_00405 [Candidatus Moranbacteria bacterium]|nr:hypothetical protein [Candidatus Moranbacteria bacterium]